MSTPPATIGSYKVARQLGAGLMGPVYLGTKDNSYWVLRLLADTQVRPTASVNRLVGDVLHDNLVRYKEVGADSQLGGFVATDFIEARPISRDALSGMRSAQRLSVVTNLLQGLAALHQRGAVHGCLKLSNVLLRRRASIATAIIIDAGFAYSTKDKSRLDRLVQQGLAPMAPELVSAYLAGEPAAIDAALTARADVYAAGVLVAEVLSGRRLFEGARDGEDLLARKRSTAVVVTGLNDPYRHLDLQALNAAIADATVYNADARIGSVRELLDRFGSCLPKAA